MNKEQILKLASEYQEFLDRVTRAALKKDSYLMNHKVFEIAYQENSIIATLGKGNLKFPEYVFLTYEELERA